jgi:hypothetical protein
MSRNNLTNGALSWSPPDRQKSAVNVEPNSGVKDVICNK